MNGSVSQRRATPPLAVLLFVVAQLLVFACLAGSAGAATDFASASFVDENHGWIAGIAHNGESSGVWKTVNGGISWRRVGSQPAAGGGTSWVAFVSRTKGVWGTGTIWRTTAGGGTWSPGVGSEVARANEASFAGKLVGWAACSYGSSESGGAILNTIDGGASWALQKDLPSPDGSGGLSKVSAPTSQRCYALKWGKQPGVWATSDGGTSWVRRALPNIAGASSEYRDVDFPAGQTGWVVGDGGAIAKTTDGGQHWAKQTSGTTKVLSAVYFVNTSSGYAVGENGTVLRTRDGGARWVKLNAATAKWLMDVCFVDRWHGWVVGGNGARLRTVNGGRTWVGNH